MSEPALSMITGADLLRGEQSLADRLCDFIIRPPRSRYMLSDLGPSRFRMDEGEDEPSFVRRDLELYNMRGMRIVCSWYLPAEMIEKPPEEFEPIPCVVYCHANCGSRFDGLEALFLLRHGFSLFTFDFCGSGKSDGEYISLGVYERQDLAAVVEYLTLRHCEVKGIGLWGRSMGAVTAIMYASKDPYIKCIMCDSPFSSLQLLISDIAATRVSRYLPEAFTRFVTRRLRDNVSRRAQFDLDELETTKYAQTCRVPALLLHGESDDFVTVKHTMRIRDWWPEKVPCLHEVFPGGHNSRRDVAHHLIASFFKLYMVEKVQGAAPVKKETTVKRNALPVSASKPPSRRVSEPRDGVKVGRVVSTPQRAVVHRGKPLNLTEPSPVINALSEGPPPQVLEEEGGSAGLVLPPSNTGTSSVEGDALEQFILNAEQPVEFSRPSFFGEQDVNKKVSVTSSP